MRIAIKQLWSKRGLGKLPSMQKPVRKIKKLTAAYLERAAIHYLGRFSSTEANLRNVLMKKAMRRVADDDEAPAELSDWIVAVITKCRDYGYVNDAQYARVRASALARKGWGERRILRDLMFKGVDEDLAKEVLGLLQDNEGVSDRTSALLLARKRKIGVYRGHLLNDLDKEQRLKVERRELGIFARAGLGFDVARTIVHAESVEDLEDEWNFRG